MLTRALQRYEQGIDWPVVTVGDEPVGRVNLNNVVLGAFCSADLGWVDSARNGHGIATAAVAAMVQVAFTEPRAAPGPGRYPAAQPRVATRVLERNGFTLIGMARATSRSPAAGRTTCSSSASPTTRPRRAQ